MSLDAHTDEHAFDAIHQIERAPAALQPLIAVGVMHGGLAVLAAALGYHIALDIMGDLRRQLDHWRAGNEIDP